MNFLMSKKENQVRNMKACLVAGARPNFMKVAPLIRAFDKYNSEKSTEQPGFELSLIHTGQHYDYEMSETFFKELEIPTPNIHLEIGSGNHGSQTGRIMIEFEKVVLKNRPDLIVVVGDVNSTISCALVATKLHIPVAHVEAGLRSFDRSMPEEINRLLTDQISDYLFTPSKDANENLMREGIPESKIFLVGDIMIDNLLFNLSKSRNSAIFKRLGLESNGSRNSIREYALLTLHRPANVDNKESLIKILNALKIVSKEIPIVFPLHPRTRKMMANFGVDKLYDFDLENLSEPALVGNTINLMPPLGYLDFLALMSNAKLVYTDSGGIQEETTVLGVPCLTLRDTTERPITLTEGTNVIVHNNGEKIIGETKKVLIGCNTKGKCPEIWDGKTSDRIVDILSKQSLWE